MRALMRINDPTENGASFFVYDRLYRPAAETRTAHNVFAADASGVSASLPVAQVYPLWRIRTNARPISVEVVREDEGWLAQQEWLNVYGIGESPGEAIADIETHIKYFFEYYAQRADESLIGFAVTLKHRYAKLAIA